MMETTNGTKTTSTTVVLDLFPEDSSGTSAIHSLNGTGGGSGLPNGFSDENVFENPFDNPPVRITFILLYTVVFAMCFLGNIVVLIVFAYSKRMRTRTNLFLANLAVADFCVGVFCVLPSLSIRLSPFWHLGRVMCKLYFFVNDLAYTASILLLVVIAAERYIAIIHPLRSRGYFTAPRLLVAQMVVWVVAAAYNIPILLMFDTTSTPDGVFCYMSLNLLNLKTYYTVHFALWYLLPLAVILTMYGRISCTLWASSTTTTIPTTTATPTTTANINNTNNTNNTSSRKELARSFPATNTSTNPAVNNHHHGSAAMDGGGGGSHHHHHHHHHYHVGGVLPKFCVPPSPSSTCISYCDNLGQNGFALVTLRSGHISGARSVTPGGVEVGGRRRGGEMGKGAGAPSPLGSLEPTLEGEEGRQGEGRATGGGRASDPEKYRQRSATQAPRRDVKEQVVLGRCRDCFGCVPSEGGEPQKGSPGQYSPRLDYSRYSHHHHHYINRSKRAKKQRNEDFAYELSDIHSSEDYDAYPGRSRANGGDGGNVLCGVGDSLKDGSGRSSNSSTPRRLRTHCRISSPRGLTSRRRVIRLLVAVVTIFALCVLPLHLRNLLHYWHVNESPGGIFDFLSPIASVMMYLNCGLNPFIYWMFSDHFRLSLRDTLCFWKRSKRKSSRMMLHSPRQLKNSLLKNHPM